MQFVQYYDQPSGLLQVASVSYTAATLTSHTHSVPQVKKAGARRQSPEHRHISLLQVS